MADKEEVRRAEVTSAGGVGQEGVDAFWWSDSTESVLNFTNTAWGEKATLDFTAPEAGDYLIFVSATVNQESSGQATLVRAQLDNTTTILDSVANYISSSTNETPTSCMYLAESLAAGDHYVDVDAYVTSGTGNLTDIQIVVVRLDDVMPTSNMYAFSNTEANGTPGFPSYSTMETLTFTPDKAGDYLILGNMRIILPTTSVIVARLNYDSGSEYLPIASTQGGSNSYVSVRAGSVGDVWEYYWGGIVNMPASSKTILLEAMATGPPGAVCGHRRILAIRLDAWGKRYEDEDTSETNTSSSSFQEKSVVDATPSVAKDHLVIGSLNIVSGNASGDNSSRVAQTDPSEDDIGTADDNNHVDTTVSMPTSSQTIKNITTAGATFKTEYRENGGDYSVYARSSFVVALEKSSRGDPVRRAHVTVAVTAEEITTTHWSSYTASKSFTASSWEEQVTLDFTAPAQGDYLIILSFSRAANTDDDAYFRVQLDDTTTLMAIGFLGRGQNEVRQSTTMHVAEDLASGDHYIDLDAYRDSGTGYIKDCSILVIRLDDILPTSGMYDSAWTEASEGTSSSWTTHQTLTFTPDKAGLYLILASAGITPAQTSQSMSWRLNYNSGSEYLPIESTEGGTDSFNAVKIAQSNENEHWMWGGIVDLPASSSTFTLQAKEESDVAANIRRRQIVAIRLGALDPAFEYDEDVSESNTSSTSMVDKSVITFTPAAAADYLIVGGLSYLLNSQVGLINAALKQTSPSAVTIFDLDADQMLEVADPPKDSIAAFSARILSLTSQSYTFKTQYSVDAGSYTAYARSSAIAVLNLGPTDPKRRAEVTVPTGGTKDETRRAEVSPTLIKDETRRAEVTASTAATKDETRRAEVLAAFSKEETRRAEVLGAFSKDEVREAAVTAAITKGETRRAEVLAAFSKDEWRRAEVAATGTKGETREANVSAAVTKDEWRRAEVLAAFSKEETRRAEVLSAFSKDEVREAAISAAVTKDETRRAEVLGAFSKDEWRRAEVGAAVTKDETRRAEVFAFRWWQISGVTKDSAGSPLGSCDVYLFKDNLDNTITYKDHVVSNAVSGVYTFTNIADNDAQYLVVAFLDGSPNRMDVTDHVLQPVAA